MNKKPLLAAIFIGILLLSSLPVLADNHLATDSLFADGGPFDLIASLFDFSDLQGDTEKIAAILKFVIWLSLLFVVREVLQRWVFMDAQRSKTGPKALFSGGAAGIIGLAVATMTVIVIPDEIIITIATAYATVVMWLLLFMLVLIVLLITFRIDPGGDDQPWLTGVMRFIMLMFLYLVVSGIESGSIVNPQLMNPTPLGASNEATPVGLPIDQMLGWLKLVIFIMALISAGKAVGFTGGHAKAAGRWGGSKVPGLDFDNDRKAEKETEREEKDAKKIESISGFIQQIQDLELTRRDRTRAKEIVHSHDKLQRVKEQIDVLLDIEASASDIRGGRFRNRPSDEVKAKLRTFETKYKNAMEIIEGNLSDGVDEIHKERNDLVGSLQQEKKAIDSLKTLKKYLEDVEQRLLHTQKKEALLKKINPNDLPAAEAVIEDMKQNAEQAEGVIQEIMTLSEQELRLIEIEIRDLGNMQDILKQVRAAVNNPGQRANALTKLRSGITSELNEVVKSRTYLDEEVEKREEARGHADRLHKDAKKLAKILSQIESEEERANNHVPTRE